MSEHDYDSAEYFAQQFRDAFLNKLKRDIGGEVKIRHSGNSLFYSLFNVGVHLSFRKDSHGRMCLSEEIGKDSINPLLSERVLNVKRSGTGRLSGDYSQELAERHYSSFMNYVKARQ